MRLSSVSGPLFGSNMAVAAMIGHTIYPGILTIIIVTPVMMRLMERLAGFSRFMR